MGRVKMSLITVVKFLKFKHGGIFVHEFASIASTDNGLCVAQDYTFGRLERVDVHYVVVFCCIGSDRQRL